MEGLRARRSRRPDWLRLLVPIPCLALVGMLACAGGSGPRVSRVGMQAEIDSALRDGVRLHEAREFALAARRFEQAGVLAEQLGDRRLALRATSAECLSWLFSRRLAELDDCSLRLEALQRRAHQTSPGANALIAMGAVAGDRPQPSIRMPSAVREIVRGAEGGR